jgi:hypothetical protein
VSLKFLLLMPQRSANFGIRTLAMPRFGVSHGLSPDRVSAALSRAGIEVKHSLPLRLTAF